MKALTLHQPYATLIAKGIKTIETRTWPAPASLIGQRIAIHAAKKAPKTVWNDGTGRDPEPLGWDEGAPWEWVEATNYAGEGRFCWGGPLGAVVATARLASCIPMFDTWDLEAIWSTDHCIQLARNPYSGDVEGYYEWEAGEDEHGYRNGGGGDEDQIKFGNFEPGNWGWMLEDIEPCDPIPAKGFQGLWNFDEAVAA